MPETQASNTYLMDWYNHFISNKKCYNLRLKIGWALYKKWRKSTYYYSSKPKIVIEYLLCGIFGNRVRIPQEFLNDLILNVDQYHKLYNLFADERSKETLLSIMTYIRTGNRDESYYNRDFDFNQYFDKDIINLTDTEIFVDCGGYIGDTMELFILRSPSFDKIYFFEPDRVNYDKAINHLSTWNKQNMNKIISYNAGVGQKNQQLGLSSKGASSKISNYDDNNIIPFYALDTIKDQFTFIKMDIEGVELAALEGAKNHIEHDKPKLAICVYHKPKDLWMIPSFILSCNSSYKLYLRQYSYDWVIYAV